nr:MAG TPA: hypothetical protein [Caudoviricetes sp.]
MHLHFPVFRFNKIFQKLPIFPLTVLVKRHFVKQSASC